MKKTVQILVLSLGVVLAGGCSRNPADSRLARDLVQEGKTVTWPDGRLLRVERRHGNTLEGVRLVQKPLPGPDRTVEAARGLVSRDPDGQTVRVTLYDALVSRGGRPVGTVKEFSVICAK